MIVCVVSQTSSRYVLHWLELDVAHYYKHVCWKRQIRLVLCLSYDLSPLELLVL